MCTVVLALLTPADDTIVLLADQSKYASQCYRIKASITSYVKETSAHDSRGRVSPFALLFIFPLGMFVLVPVERKWKE